MCATWTNCQSINQSINQSIIRCHQIKSFVLPTDGRLRCSFFILNGEIKAKCCSFYCRMSGKHLPQRHTHTLTPSSGFSDKRGARQRFRDRFARCKCFVHLFSTKEKTKKQGSTFFFSSRLTDRYLPRSTCHQNS